MGGGRETLTIVRFFNKGASPSKTKTGLIPQCSSLRILLYVPSVVSASRAGIQSASTVVRGQDKEGDERMWFPLIASPVLRSLIAIWNWYNQILASTASRLSLSDSGVMGLATGESRFHNPWTP